MSGGAVKNHPQTGSGPKYRPATRAGLFATSTTNDMPRFDNTEIIDTVRSALEDGDRDALRGGIPVPVIVERMDRHRSTIEDNCRELADEGKLVVVHGVPPGCDGHPRISFLPADHPDAPDSNPDPEPSPP